MRKRIKKNVKKYALVFLGISLVMSIWFLSAYIKQEEFVTWVRTNCTERSKGIIINHSSGGSFGRIYVKWFDKEGQSHHTQSGNSNTYGLIGDSVDIVYNPTKLDQSVIDMPSELESALQSYFVGFWFSLSVFIILTIYNYLLFIKPLHLDRIMSAFNSSIFEDEN